jgi:hypothetical protein
MKARDLKMKPPKLLIYGPHGTGKTGVVAQLSGGYVIDTDDGMRTALNLKDDFTKYRHEVEFDTFVENPKQPTAWVKIKECAYKVAREVRAGTWKYDALGIDSLTRCGQYCTNQVLMQAGRPLEPPQLQDYNVIVTEIKNFLQLLTSLPILVIVCGHEVPIESDGRTMIKPKSVGQKLPDEVSCMFDEVWHTHIKKGIGANKANPDFVASWLPSTSHECRTRSGELKEVSMKDLGLRGLLREAGFSYVHEPA